MFQVGEKVVYPQYGLGIITEVTERVVADKVLNFYRLQFLVRQMEIFVPVQRAKENGLRRVMPLDEVNDLVAYVTARVDRVQPQQWHRWRKKTQEQLRTGEPMDMAGIYVYLSNLEKKKGLSFTERKILIQVERLLITEVAAAKQISEEEAEALLLPGKKEAALQAAM